MNTSLTLGFLGILGLRVFPNEQNVIKKISHENVLINNNETNKKLITRNNTRHKCFIYDMKLHFYFCCGNGIYIKPTLIYPRSRGAPDIRLSGFLGYPVTGYPVAG